MTYTIRITNKNTVSGASNVNTLYLDTISPSLITDLKSTYEAFIADMEVTDTSIYVPLYKRLQVVKIPASSVLVITTDDSSEATYYRLLKLNNSFILINPDPITSAHVDPVLIEKTIIENGIYIASQDNADGYSLVDVNVPNSYSAEDEGKVVNNGALVSQTSTSATTNGIVDTTLNNSIDINVPNTYTVNDNGKVVNNQELIAQTAYPDTVTTNNTYNTTNYNSITVDVANTYSQADNGKVVSNQQLVSQTAYPTTITENDTYDTTNYNSIIVNVSGGGGGSSFVAESEFDYNNNYKSLLQTIEIPNGVETIASEAFRECTSLTSVTIPSSVTGIGDNAFAECTSLENVLFESQSSLETIGTEAFCACASLTSVTIPDSVTSIGSYAFSGCNALSSITFEPTTPPDLDGDLDIETTCIIRVPQGSLSDYTSASNYPDPNDYIYEEY